MSDRTSRASGDRINPVVFYGSSLGILLFALWTMIFTESAQTLINTLLGWVSESFGWYYFVVVLVYLFFVIGIGLSRYGDIKLGPKHSQPEFSLLSWAAMLFSAGIGIDLLFFCVAEPVTQFLAPPVGEGGTTEAAREAIKLTYLHWGLSGWGIYSLVGMSLAFFSYRHGLPLTIRSALFPIFGKRIEGPIGHTVDIAAVLGTVFGIATSLGIGVIQLNYGLNLMFGIAENTLVQAVLVVLIILFATLSAISGVDKGIRRLSEFNMLLALVLMLFVLFTDRTLFLLNALVMNAGDYLTGFVSLSTETYAFDRPSEWLNAWTLFFWAWWIAWGPFVGLFLARISRGRRIREFVAGTLILPMVFMMVWMSIMGNSAIDMVMQGAGDFGDQAMNNPASSIYLFLQQLPWAGLTTIVATVLAIVFFVTSGDSGALVLSNFTYRLENVNNDAPAWMRTLWAAIIGALTLALLMAGGLNALQSAVVVTGLPFSIVLFFMMFGLYRALKTEGYKERSHIAAMSGYLSGRISDADAKPGAWRKRLSRAMRFPDRAEAEHFMADTARKAMDAVREALAGQNIAAEIDGGASEDTGLVLRAAMADEQDFVYGIWPTPAIKPSFATGPQSAEGEYYRLEVHLIDGSQGYDLMHYSQAQIIDDILDQYERHLTFLHIRRQAFGGAKPIAGEQG